MRHLVGLAILDDQVMIVRKQHPLVFRERSFYGQETTNYWPYFRAVVKRPRLPGFFLRPPKILIASDIRYQDAFFHHRLPLAPSSPIVSIDPGIVITAGCGVDIRLGQRTLFIVSCKNRLILFIHFCGGIFHPMTLERQDSPLSQRLKRLFEQLYLSDLPVSLLFPDFDWTEQDLSDLRQNWKKPLSQQVHIVNGQVGITILENTFGDSEDFDFVVHQNYHDIYEQGLRSLCTDELFIQLAKTRT